MSRKFGLVAKRHSGKTTLANFFINDYDFDKVAFADPLKDLYVDMHNLFLERIGFEPNFTRAKLEAEKEFHRIDLERLGTIHGRGKDDSCWVRLAKDSIKRKDEISRLAGGQASFVCDDVRFLNEVEALRESGFTIIKIVRDEDERIESIRSALEKQYERVHPLLATRSFPVWELDRAKWVKAELEKTLTLPSEVEVDLIEADICVANTSLEELERCAARAAAIIHWGVTDSGVSKMPHGY